eukprot:m.41173 g.41173  ORF g.41173 m.41173 type:complete len:478 (-) comp10522_c0_seq3:115-1548(-)
MGGLLVAAVVCVALALRMLTALGPHSGSNKPPMYGDFEAQRHWMEITTGTPISEWYHETPMNNLSYWGLDYPPLTAYHSYACGMVANMIDPSWMALNASRGIETPGVKLFMRYTVLVADVLILVPAVVLWANVATRTLKISNVLGTAGVVAVVMLNPTLTLVDHGHFQYNNMSLGLALLSFALLVGRGGDLLASVFFVLSLCYKQMSLYFAPAIFFYLLGKSFANAPNTLAAIQRVIIIGFVVIATFALCFFPFYNQLPQVLHRIFPIARGLFEDKVASFWCVSDPFLKLRFKYPLEQLLQMSFGTTLAALLPACLYMMRHPTKKAFLYTLLISALSFFAFSFQVHEKSILLPLLPVLMIQDPFPTAFFSLIASFSIFPLMQKDELELQYYVWMAASALLFPKLLSFNRWSLVEQMLYVLTVCGIAAIHIAIITIPPPTHLPHLYELGIAATGFLGVIIIFLHAHYKLWNSAPQVTP